MATPDLDTISPLAWAIITLARGEIVLVDIEDYEHLATMRWYKNSSGYATHSLNERDKRLMARYIMKAPVGKEVDHINRNRLDNRKANLRLVTKSENTLNKSIYASNSVGLKGVTLLKSGRYLAQIQAYKKHYYLGTYPTPQEAHLVYKLKAKELHGEYCAV